MRFDLILIIGCLLSSCQKKEHYEYVHLIGHAGSGLYTSTSPYEPNSQKSISYAAHMEGIAGVEIDVQCSASESMWLFHDEYLDDATNGQGCVNSVSDGYLSDVKYDNWNSEKLLRLTDLTFPFEERKLFLDVRSSNVCTQMLIDQQKIIQSIETALEGKPLSEVNVIINKKQWIHAFFLKGWNVYLNLSSADEYVSASLLAETKGLCIRSSEISKEEVQMVQQTGKEVLIFEVRSPKGIRRALKKLPNYLMTDNLKAAIIEKYP